MANEITVQASLRVNKSNIVHTFTPPSIQPTMTGEGRAAGTVEIPTTAAGTALVIPANVGTTGWSFFRHTGSANFIEVGVQTGGTTFLPFVKLLPGEYALLRLGTNAPYARSDTLAQPLQYDIFEL